MNEQFTAEDLVPRRYRLTIRARLALTYAALLTGAGLIMLTIIVVFFGLVPDYDFAVPTTLVLAPTDSPTIGPTGGISSAPTTEVLAVSSREDLLRLLLLVSGGVLLLLAIGGIAAGWLLARRMLRPLQHVSAAARGAARGHLDYRIGLSGPSDEITELAETFDEMLAELERAFDSHRRFAANASHELRTPLATVRAMLDVAIATTDEREAPLLTRLRKVNERSIATVEALLDLSKIQAVATQLEPVDLADVVAEGIDEITEEAKRAGLVIDYEIEQVVVAGDRVLLRQLCQNLLQNAVRHNAVDGRIIVRLGPGDGATARLDIINDGLHVPLDVVGRLTTPFMRVEGRTNRDPSPDRGFGLGLSIVAAIVERHHGTLQLATRAEGGLATRVALPRGSAT